MPVLRFRTYLFIFCMSLMEQLAYRLDFMLIALLRFLPVTITIILWQAVYTGIDRRIRGYTLGDIVAYLLLIQVSRFFVTMPSLAERIARDIRDGGLKKYLLQPIELLPYLMSVRAAHAIAAIVISAIPYAVLVGFFYQYLTLPASNWTWLAYGLSLLLSFVIGYYLQAIIGMAGFWFLEIRSFVYVTNVGTFFLSGQMLPLDLLPGPWAQIVEWLPFGYLGYVPATIFLERLNGPEMSIVLLIQALWAFAFAATAHVLYRGGLRQYGAYGG